MLLVTVYGFFYIKAYHIFQMFTSVFLIRSYNSSIVYVKQKHTTPIDNKQCPLKLEYLEHELDLICVHGAKDTAAVSIKR